MWKWIGSLASWAVVIYVIYAHGIGPTSPTSQ